MSQFLFASQIMLSRLNRCVTKQELNLIKFPARQVAYDSCELAAASELRTAFFDCSKSGSRSTVLARERLLVFFRCPILAASCAAFSMVIHLEG